MAPYDINPLEYFAPQTLPMMDRNWYPPEFFTGCDVKFVIARRDTVDSNPTGVVDLSGYLEDDIMDFQFSAMQPKRPLYSYASYRWHRLILGQLIIQGQFAIPFTKKFKVFEALQQAAADGRRSNFHSDMLNGSLAQNAERLKKNWEGLTLDEKIQVIKEGDLSGNLADMLTPIGFDLARDVTSTLGSRRWGVRDRFGVGSDGLEIIVHYSGADPRAINAFEAIKNRAAETIDEARDRVLALHRVHLHSATQVIRPKGSPVLEQYSFVAWDFD